MVWPSSSGGGSSSSRFTVSVDSGKNGSVTVSPKRAEKGDTVTITVKPNEGYELDKLVVTGKNGGEVKLTNEGGGKYTFKMPASRVEIEASFAKIETEPKLPFADVSSGDWYYDAVVYVYKNGLMDGTGPAAFAPTTVLTRSGGPSALEPGGQPCRPRYGRLHRRAVGRVVRRCGELVGGPGDCDRVQHRGLRTGGRSDTGAVGGHAVPLCGHAGAHGQSGRL